MQGVDARIAEKVGDGSETRALWLFRADRPPAEVIRNIEIRGVIIRRQQAAVAGKNQGQEKRKGDAEEEPIWTSFLERMHDVMGPEWVQECTTAGGEGHDV